jgi:hypothetical protein
MDGKSPQNRAHLRRRFIKVRRSEQRATTVQQFSSVCSTWADLVGHRCKYRLVHASAVPAPLVMGGLESVRTKSVYRIPIGSCNWGSIPRPFGIKMDVEVLKAQVSLEPSGCSRRSAAGCSLRGRSPRELPNETASAYFRDSRFCLSRFSRRESRRIQPCDSDRRLAPE